MTLERFRPAHKALGSLIAALLATAAMGAAPTVTIDCPELDHVVTSPTAEVSMALGTGDGSYDLRLRVVGWDGQQVYSNTTGGVSAGWSGTASVPLDRYGPYDVFGELLSPGTTSVVQAAAIRLVRPVPVDPLTPEQRRGSYIGINTHYGTHWQTLSRCGIHWVRDYAFAWLGDGAVAPMASNGVDFMGIWNDAKAANITILPNMIQAYWNPAKNAYTTDWASVTAAYDRIMRALPEIEYWELDNEAKYYFTTILGMPVATYHDQYRNYIHAAAQGAALAGGGRKIVLDGTAGIQMDTAIELLKTSGVSPVVADEFDVVNYHHYAGASPPETNNLSSCPDGTLDNGWWDPNQTILSLMQAANNHAHAAGKEVWYTEFGYAEMYDRGVGLRNQTAYLPRAYLLARSVGCDKCFWFWDHDLNEYNWIATMGLIEGVSPDTLQVRPIGAALAALSKFTALSTVTGSGSLGSDSWYVAFRQADGSTLLAAWTLGQLQPYDASAASAAYDIFANEIPAGTVMLGPEVTYLLYAPGAINIRPTVEAGPDQTITAPVQTVDLAGVVNDDGYPAPPGQLTLSWTKASGPGQVTFADPAAAGTTASFSRPGAYVLRLTADDGEQAGSDTINIEVHGPPIVIDNGDSGYAETGGFWWHGSSEGYLGDCAGAINLANGYATFQFSGLQSGQYVVRTTYTALANRSATVPYTIYDGTPAGTALGTVIVNQQAAPDGYVYNGWKWAQLEAGSYRITGSTLTVKIAVVPGEGYSMADAVMLERVSQPGDFNGDGAVTQGDYTIWADTYGYDGSPGKTDLRADGNGDGHVTHGDYTIWADNYGQSIPQAAMVGEAGVAASSASLTPAVNDAPPAVNETPVQDTRAALRRAARLQDRQDRRLQRAAARAAKNATRAARTNR